MNITEQSYFTQIKKMNNVYCCSSSQGKKKEYIPNYFSCVTKTNTLSTRCETSEHSRIGTLIIGYHVISWTTITCISEHYSWSP